MVTVSCDTWIKIIMRCYTIWTQDLDSVGSESPPPFMSFAFQNLGFLSLNVLICKVGIIMVPFHRVVVRII